MSETTSPIDLTDKELQVLINTLADRIVSGVTRELTQPFYGFYTKLRSAAAERGIPLPRDDTLALEFLEQTLPFSKE